MCLPNLFCIVQGTRPPIVSVRSVNPVPGRRSGDKLQAVRIGGRCRQAPVEKDIGLAGCEGVSGQVGPLHEESVTRYRVSEEQLQTVCALDGSSHQIKQAAIKTPPVRVYEG